MLCTKCGADNHEDDIFCTNCGAVLTGVSLDDPEPEQTPAIQVYAQQISYEQPVPPQQSAYHQQASYGQQPVYEIKGANPQPRQRKRRKRNPQGIEWIPLGGSILAFLFLFLPWFSIFDGFRKYSLVKFLYELLKGIGDLGFLDFLCLALYLVLIASPVMIAWFAWRRDNNYMGLSLLAITSAILAYIFTSIAIGKGVGFGTSVGFYLYILAVAVVIAGGVMISMQRQKNPRRPKTR